jgi:general secretion pathway protein G
MNHRWTRLSRAGFTLMEIMLVMVILLLLVGVVAPRIVGKGKTARINTTKIQINSLKLALQDFEIHASRFPTTSEGLEALVTKPSGLSNDEWPDKYMDEIPFDGWGMPFDYKCPSAHGKEYDIISGGPDKTIGGDDDITNFDQRKTENL